MAKKRESYEFKIQWSERTEDSGFVLLTEREAKLLGNIFSSAEANGVIDGFTLEKGDPTPDTFDGLMAWLQSTPLGNFFGPREWSPKEKE